MDSDNAYVYGPGDTPLEQVSLASGDVSYLVADSLGSVRGVVNGSDGSLAASTSYDAWGNPETAGGLSSLTPFGYAGGYTDPSGLLYLVHRYYDPSTGQFLSVDPLVATTDAPYAYGLDDPVVAVDPVGLCSHWSPWCDVQGVASAVDTHWRGIAQVATAATVGIGSAICVAATDGVCIAALPAIGAITSDALYAEGAGHHDFAGYIRSASEGAVGGAVAGACLLGGCDFAGGIVLGGVVVNGIYGAAQGAFDYYSDTRCRTASGYVDSASVGLIEGGVPWDLLLRITPRTP